MDSEAMTEIAKVIGIRVLSPPRRLISRVCAS